MKSRVVSGEVGEFDGADHPAFQFDGDAEFVNRIGFGLAMSLVKQQTVNPRKAMDAGEDGFGDRVKDMVMRHNPVLGEEQDFGSVLVDMARVWNTCEPRPYRYGEVMRPQNKQYALLLQEALSKLENRPISVFNPR
jgi:hypothetical protein